MAFPISLSHLKPPYYAVIFTSTRHPTQGDGYSETDAQMEIMARAQPGFLGFEWVSQSATANGGPEGEVQSMSVSYWESDEDIKAWKRVLEHLAAQARGKKEWYLRFELRVCRVERAYGWTRKEKL